MADTLVLNPDLVRLATLERIYRQQSAVRLTPSAAVIAAMAMGKAPVLWGQTGFGKLALVRLAPEGAAAQQRNLVHSHCRADT